MFSQSLFAQLARMTLLLSVSLVILHHSPALVALLAQQAADSGCHQSNQPDTHHSHSKVLR
ncbi:hypothetical protein FCU94_16960 [Vibrio sp. JPW-9-11-11]|uniref:hypothetical protein n=1 Tax=Vibrio sp. JPW-9-11-11 TaxID=1416532 RepID=UPI0015932DDA|nr:hypothetical protein [Vibrio sp. JPW-9-11-11]NVD08537.1 hypothetical protein [Vibrio sp. JPW-9-11-11]